MPFHCLSLGAPSPSGTASISNLSVAAQSGAPITCLLCTPYANEMRSLSEVLRVVNRRPMTLNPLPGASGLLGLMVATSKLGDAFASIGGIGGGGLGMGHSVSGVARVKVRGTELPWLQLPTIVFPSALSFPS